MIHSDLAHAKPPTSPHPSSTSFESDLFSNLNALESLLAAAMDSDPEDEEHFLGSLDNNRRADRRHPFLAEMAVVLVTEPDLDGHSFKFVRGWTQNLSPGGVAFVTDEPIPPGRHLMLIQHPDYPSPKHCFLGTIVWERQSLSDWEYGAVIRPSFDSQESLAQIEFLA